MLVIRIDNKENYHVWYTGIALHFNLTVDTYVYRYISFDHLEAISSQILAPYIDWKIGQCVLTNELHAEWPYKYNFGQYLYLISFVLFEQ